MKRHQCRHCGQVLDTYAALKRHLASHATPAVIEHTYSVAPPLDVPREVPRRCHLASRQSERSNSCKCDATFDIWDDLQHHVRSVCRLSSSRSRSSSSSSNRKQTTVDTCAKCGMTFNKRVNLTRHVRNACTADDDTTPPSPKISIREDTTPNHPLVTDADPIDPTCPTPLRRQPVVGTVRCRTSSLVDHTDTCNERSSSVQVRLQSNDAGHDRSRAVVEERVLGTDQRVQD